MKPLVPGAPGAPRPKRQRVSTAEPAPPPPLVASEAPAFDPTAACADGLLDRKAAARFLGVGVTTLRAVVEREVPVRRIGRRVLIPRAALVAYAAAQLEAPEALR